MAEKGKSLAREEREEEQPDCLRVRIYHGVDIDKDFRRVTNFRFYSVKAWIHPSRVYSTGFRQPNLFRQQLDPEWNEELTIPIGELDRVEDLMLHLELVRGLRTNDDHEIIVPGPSNLQWVVGRVRMSLDGLEAGNQEWHQKALKLLQRDVKSEGGWKPEGYIWVKLMLE